MGRATGVLGWNIPGDIRQLEKVKVCKTVFVLLHRIKYYII